MYDYDYILDLTYKMSFYKYDLYWGAFSMTLVVE